MARPILGHEKSPLNIGKPEMATRGNYLDKVQRAYAAGFIDADGCISLIRNKSHSCKRGYRHRSYVAMTNTNLAICQRMKAWFGGTVSSTARVLTGHKRVYQWRLNSLSEIDNCLTQIRPYLFVKRKQADIVMDFLRNGGKGYTGYGVSDDEWERREALIVKIQRLNLRGAEPQRLSEESEVPQTSQAIVQP